MDGQALALVGPSDLLEQLHLRSPRHGPPGRTRQQPAGGPRRRPWVGPNQMSTTASGGAKTGEHTHLPDPGRHLAPTHRPTAPAGHVLKKAMNEAIGFL